MPFAINRNIGAEYNARIADLPNDCYVLILDGDTCFLTSDWGNRIHDIIEANPDYDIIGCMTNRIGLPDLLVPGMFDESDIGKHIDKANELTGTEIKPFNCIGGFFMLFKKSIWEKVKFKENTILFDKFFCIDAYSMGYKIGVATGFYILHLYRYNQKDPLNYKAHLLREPDGK